MIILDLTRNLYMCVPNALKAWPQIKHSNADLACALTKAGLRVEWPQGGHLSYQPPPKPLGDIGEPPKAKLCWRDVGEAAIATIDLWVNYRARSLSQLITLVERSGAREGQMADADHACDLARRFQTWIVLAPVSGKCLARSFMLLRYLHRKGLRANWVFGVRSWPFRAHCWIQADQIVLDDAHERLIAYEPILAVRA